MPVTPCQARPGASKCVTASPPARQPGRQIDRQTKLPTPERSAARQPILSGRFSPKTIDAPAWKSNPLRCYQRRSRSGSDHLGHVQQLWYDSSAAYQSPEPAHVAYSGAAFGGVLAPLDCRHQSHLPHCSTAATHLLRCSDSTECNLAKFLRAQRCSAVQCRKGRYTSSNRRAAPSTAVAMTMRRQVMQHMSEYGTHANT